MTAITVRKRLIVSTAFLIAAVATLAVLFRPGTTQALPSYAPATGQACGVCHINPDGGGPRTAIGQAFEAIPSHSTDPAGAWAIVNPTPTATSTPSATATSTPSATATPKPDDDDDEGEADEDEDEDHSTPTVTATSVPSVTPNATPLPRKDDKDDDDHKSSKKDDGKKKGEGKKHKSEKDD